MNRAAFMRVAAAVAGGLAAVAALAFLVVASTGGSSGISIARGAGWVVPLVAGGTVGTLSWLLLAGDDGHDEDDTGRVTVCCPTCGNELLSDWRLCPYCGGSNECAPAEMSSSTHLA